MTCTYDRERLALYVNDDLLLSEQLAVELHVADCSVCAKAVEQYRAGAEVIRALHPDVTPASSAYRRRSTMPIRLVAVAAGVIALVGFLLTSQGAVLAKRLERMLPFMWVHEMSKAEVEQFTASVPKWNEANVTLAKVDEYKTFDEAAAVFGDWLARPGYLPPGLKLERVLAGTTLVEQWYRNPENGWYLTIRQFKEQVQGTKAPEGMIREVQVNGQSAFLIHGSWGQYANQAPKWEPDQGDQLYFQWKGQSVMVEEPGIQTKFTPEDLIKVAESLK